MRSLRRVFNEIRKENPYWSDYICFAEAVKSRQFSKKTIFQHSDSLIDKDEYVRGEKKQILKFLVSFREVAEEG